MPKPKPKPASAPARATRSVTAPGPEDLEHAGEDALLQLRIGRSAHLYTVLISAALALDGILVLLFAPHVPSLPASVSGLRAVRDSAFLLVPIAAGLAISSVALAAKWEAFQLWPWEPHFSTTVGAVILNVGIALGYLLRVLAIGPFAHLDLLPGYYALSLGGISLALVGLVLTWSKWGARQWASAAAAGAAIVTSILLFVGTPNGAPGAAGLAISLFLAAILYQTAGSFLHLISSGTRAHERELISSGQSRMFRLADELQGKEEALAFREAALVRRESDVENGEASLLRQQASLKEAREQLAVLEREYRSRSDSLVEEERAWAARLATIDSRERLAEDRLQAVDLREQEVARMQPQLSEREQRLVVREGSLARRQATVEQQAAELQRRSAAAAEMEARLEARRAELERKTQELLRREGDVTAVEAMAKTAVRPPEAAASDLAAREARLQQFKAALDEQNLKLGRTARETAEAARHAEEALARAAEREGALAAREASLREREEVAGRSTADAQARRTEYESTSREYTRRLEQLQRDQAELAQRGADVARRDQEVARQEGVLRETEARLRAERAALEEQSQTVLRRQRELEARGAEVGLRRAELARGTDLSMASLAAVANADRLELPSRSRAERGARGSPRPLPEPADPEPEGLLAAPREPKSDRVPTGISRLDDLLLGGLPPRAHLVLLGDTFVGKEIILYTFLAEGLKLGEPAILVTGARSPEEVAESMGIVLPQFREFERLGLVSWIDASGDGAEGTPHRIVTRGPADRAGILAGLAQVAKQIETDRPGRFRVGFLGLSAVVGGGDDRSGLAFLQNAVGILKLREAVAMYGLEGGALSEAQVEALLVRMDGAIEFRQERDKTYLAVRGLGEVQTHDWIECRATNRALIIGSFALERIR